MLEDWCDPVLGDVVDHTDWGVLLLTYGRIRTELREFAAAEELLDLAEQVFSRAPGVTREMSDTLRYAQNTLGRVRGGESVFCQFSAALW